MKIYDKEANRKRIEEQLTAFLEKAYRKSKSLKSRGAKLTALSVFCGFKRKLPYEILSEFKQRKLDPYACLGEFVACLTKIVAAPHIIKDYVSGVKKWLVFSKANSIVFK